MTFDLSILDGFVVNTSDVKKYSIYVDNGRIVKISKSRYKAEKKIDASDHLVMPGFVDLHVHLRDGEEKRKEDFYSGTRAAARGGYTTVADMPNHAPAITNRKLLIENMERAKKAIVDVKFYGAITDDNVNTFNEMDDLTIGHKAYVDAPSTGGISLSYENLFKALFSLRKMLVLHCEDKATIESAKEKYKEEVDPRVHCKIRPPDAEVTSVREVLKNLISCGLTDTHVHFTHISTYQAAKCVRKAKMYGFNVTWDSTSHYLLLNEDYMKQRGTIVKMNPPLRKEEIRKELFNAFLSDPFPVHGSDHAPHETSEKQKDMWHAPSGMPMLDHGVNVASHIIEQYNVHPSFIVKAFSYNPSRLLGLKDRGIIALGRLADLVIFNPETKEKIVPEILETKARECSPFLDWEMGKTAYTIYRGNILVEDGKIII